MLSTRTLFLESLILLAPHILHILAELQMLRAHDVASTAPKEPTDIVHHGWHSFRDGGYKHVSGIVAPPTSQRPPLATPVIRTNVSGRRHLY